MLRSTPATPRTVDVSPREPTASEIERALARFARQLSWTLKVKGTHPSGITYEQLLGYLAEQGRDFLADSPRLHEHVRKALVEQFGGDARMPGRAQLAQVTEGAILEWVVSRFETNLRDVPIAANAPGYKAWKRRHAKYSAPGMSSGALRDRVRDSARVKVTTP